MERFKRWTLRLWVVGLLAAATLTVLGLPDEQPVHGPEPGGGLLRAQGKERFSYRLLSYDDAQAEPGRLTLGRFEDGHFCASATWTFESLDRWYLVAPAIFRRERAWTAEQQPGWRIRRWLGPSDDPVGDRDRLFWRIQTLCYLDPLGFAPVVQAIERADRRVMILLTDGGGRYDFERHILRWDPVSDESLLSLAHQLAHAWHDLCSDGAAADNSARQRVALAVENRIRRILPLKAPGHWAHLPQHGSLEVPVDRALHSLADVPPTHED